MLRVRGLEEDTEFGVRVLSVPLNPINPEYLE